MTNDLWTPAETETLMARFYAGKGMKAIAKELGRSYWATEAKVRREIQCGNIVDRGNMVWRSKQLLTAGYTVQECAEIIGCPEPIAVLALHELAPERGEARGVV